MIFALLCAIGIGSAIWLQGGTDARPLAFFQSIEQSIRSLFSQPDHEEVDSQERSLQSRVSAATESHTTSNIHYATNDHSANDKQVCSRPRTMSRADTGAQLVYKWTDDEGQTHMSDTPPNDHIASVVDIAGNKRDFTYQIVADGVQLPTTFEGQIAAGSKRMYDTWHFFLGETRLRQSQIKLRVIGGPARFDAFRAKAWPGSKPSYGFYSNSKNEAYVRYDPKHPGQTLRSSFHEISHLITASHLGPTPKWLTEGLAEYFETMEVKHQGGTIHPNKAHLARLKKSQLPRLSEFLAIDRARWNGPQRDLNYAMAWGLMHFLMEGAPGMYAMQSVVQQAHGHFCQPFSAAEALDGAYPGGLQRLERDWRDWLKREGAAAHQT
ncbi:MAG: DUF4124 domain-containing protein [Halioglobus sp.]